MNKYQITYVHNSQKQTIKLEADDEREVRLKFKKIAPDVPEDNVLSVALILSPKKMLTKKVMVGIIFILLGIFIYTKKWFIDILSARLGLVVYSFLGFNPGGLINFLLLWGFILIGAGLIIRELLAIFRMNK